MPITIDESDADERQLLLALLAEVRANAQRLDLQMADLATAVTDIQTAVSGTAARVAEALAAAVALNTQLTEANVALAANDAADAAAIAADQATIADLLAQQSAKLVEAQGFADSLEIAASDLGAIAAAPPPAV